MAKFSAYLSQNRMSHVPQLVMGALVSFTDNMADEPELESLCISDTNYMLVELPSVPATEELIGSFKKLRLMPMKKPWRSFSPPLRGR